MHAPTILASSVDDPEALRTLVDKLQTRNAPLWYLAYGSNLSSETFIEKRKIRPLAAKNVFVRELELTFDLPGLPYLEPRFANSRIAANSGHVECHLGGCIGEKREQGASRRSKSEEDVRGEFGGLIGVAYLVTPEDFAQVVKTEGGGAGYEVMAAKAEVLEKDVKDSICLTGEAFEVITLCASPSQTRGTTGYPSLRYITIIRTGARGAKLADYSTSYVLQNYRTQLTSTICRLPGQLSSLHHQNHPTEDRKSTFRCDLETYYNVPHNHRIPYPGR